MKVCFAVEKDEGRFNSVVYGHFGSAPAFVMVDTDSGSTSGVGNRDMIHEHGACNPVMAIGGRGVDERLVGGIGAGALNRLNAEGIRVFASSADTVGKNMDLLKEGSLSPSPSCARARDIREAAAIKKAGKNVPIYEYRCEKCGEVTELLVMNKEEAPTCKACGSETVTKLMSAHNTSVSPSSFSVPATGSCCGSPNSCGSPGSCCTN